ncbi:MAG: FkbM family methyltransferase [Acidimicrobiales bacterium]
MRFRVGRRSRPASPADGDPAGPGPTPEVEAGPSPSGRPVPPSPTGLDVLLAAPRIGRMSDAERVAMTISCPDTTELARVPEAGTVVDRDGRRVQILHNGTVVEADGYCGPWMTEIIRELGGYHEPQEERAFAAIVDRLDPAPTIVEVGAFWAYYSLWVNHRWPDGRAVAVEPDPHNRALGERNAALNAMADRMTFLAGAAGSDHGATVRLALDSDPTQSVESPVMSLDGLRADGTVDRCDILHLDVQGAEYDALLGAREAIAAGALRFVVISTHHYLFSGTPLTHSQCLQFVDDHGGHLIAHHTVAESYSGDGLIVASFDQRDRDLQVPVSRNHTDRSLFRPLEEDVATLVAYIDGQG